VFNNGPQNPFLCDSVVTATPGAGSRLLEEHGRTWKVYVGEPDRFSATGLIHYARLKDRFETHFVPFAQFEADAANGDLPDFSFIEPCLILGHGDVRPIRHYTERRVRAHVFLCMLAGHLLWHLRAALAPLTFTDEDPPARTDPVRPAARSRAADRGPPGNATTTTPRSTTSAACSPTSAPSPITSCPSRTCPPPPPSNSSPSPPPCNAACSTCSPRPYRYA